MATGVMIAAKIGVGLVAFAVVGDVNGDLRGGLGDCLRRQTAFAYYYC